MDFSLTINLESTPMEDGSLQDTLLKVLIEYDPDYEEILNDKWQDKETKESGIIRELPEIMSKFKNVRIERGKSAASFDLLIGQGAIPEDAKDLEKDLRSAFTEIKSTVVRIVEGVPSIGDYSRFASDLKLVSEPHGTFISQEREEVGRALLVLTQAPDQQFVDYVRNRKNWPKDSLFSRVPIDVVFKEGFALRVILAS